MLDALPPPCQPTEEALQEARRQLAALQPAASVCSPVRRPARDSTVQHPASRSLHEVPADGCADVGCRLRRLRLLSTAADSPPDELRDALLTHPQQPASLGRSKRQGDCI